jgi:hypothetical protein
MKIGNIIIEPTTYKGLILIIVFSDNYNYDPTELRLFCLNCNEESKSIDVVTTRTYFLFLIP